MTIKWLGLRSRRHEVKVEKNQTYFEGKRLRDELPILMSVRKEQRKTIKECTINL